jgi:hypothetical protein
MGSFSGGCIGRTVLSILFAEEVVFEEVVLSSCEAELQLDIKQIKNNTDKILNFILFPYFTKFIISQVLIQRYHRLYSISI